MRPKVRNVVSGYNTPTTVVDQRCVPQALLESPLTRLKTILALSSLVHRLCQSQHETPCTQIAEVQQFVNVLKESLAQGCGGQGAFPVAEVSHVMLYIIKYHNKYIYRYV